ncbi:hypothetical protein NST50_14200 [Paenibacillus sp. FSL E2-0202]|uniref:hyaluronate lyase N-terminal domain-containing protein n=1 Tax=Paenibacillus sp. FSL E2-0202 TaxID=2954505 RepID=UPI0030EC0D8F
MANKIQIMRGTKAQLTTKGALALGELGYCTDTGELYVGNGSGANTKVSASETERTTWNAKASTAAATSSSAGLMPAADKAKLDGVTGPWGNNTDTTRPAGDMSRYASIGQGVSASALSKIIFTFAANNQKGTSDIANSRFVVPETGYYLVNGRAGITGGSTYTQLLLYVNGSINAVLGESTQNASSGLTLSGASILRLQAGWTLEFYVFVNSNATISPNPESTQVSLIRVA